MSAEDISQDDLAPADELEDDASSPEDMWAELDAAELQEQDSDDLEAGSPPAESDGEPADNPPDTDKTAAGSPPAAEQSVQPDVWRGATEAQVAAWRAADERAKRLEQSERSQRGRISAMQRQINELQARVTPQGAAPVGAAASAKTSAGAESVLNDPEWVKFKKEYPDVAPPVEKLIGTLLAQSTRLEQELTAASSDRRQAALIEQAELLTQQHEDWLEVSAETGFAEWLPQQPRHIQEAFARNMEQIVDAMEAADVVGRYKEFRVKQSGDAGTGKPAASQTQRDTRRQRQLESATGTRKGGPSVASGIPENGDPEVIWKQLDEIERRQQARRA